MSTATTVIPALGYDLAAKRLAAGVSLRDLATRSGLTVWAIRRAELSGKIDPADARRIDAALYPDPSAILATAPTPEPAPIPTPRPAGSRVRRIPLDAFPGRTPRTAPTPEPAPVALPAPVVAPVRAKLIANQRDYTEIAVDGHLLRAYPKHTRAGRAFKLWTIGWSAYVDDTPDGLTCSACGDDVPCRHTVALVQLGMMVDRRPLD